MYKRADFALSEISETCYWTTSPPGLWLVRIIIFEGISEISEVSEKCGRVGGGVRTGLDLKRYIRDIRGIGGTCQWVAI